ncbi:uncharacterized protein LOC142528475 [Primulina tabacum]|uniref:uncharacterized protein LOC142528475 n=1 Tax=Primulina tabacum TaxID=48773 RepID=UPI003F5A23BD
MRIGRGIIASLVPVQLFAPSLDSFNRRWHILGYVTGVRDKPTDHTNPDYAVSLNVWEADNSKIIMWINNFVAHSIGAQLAKYETAKEVWDHLTRLYTQSNFAKQYQLEKDFRALQQKDMSIQDFYSAMSTLWDQLALTESAELRAFSPYIARREEQRLLQFLMALRNDFEGLRGTILHRNPLPSVDSVVSELLAEEIRLKSHIDKGTIPITPSVFAAPQRPQANHQNRTKMKWAYRPPQSNNAVAAPSLDLYLFEQFQQFLASRPHAMSAYSHIGLSSSRTSGISSSIWVLDSGASHHMSLDLSSFASLSHNFSIEIVTADGTPMPLVGVGSLVTCRLSLPDVYYIPNFTLNLVSDPRSQRLIGTDVWGPSPVPTKGGRDIMFLLLMIALVIVGETPEQNGVAERKHRHIVEIARSFLLSSNVPSAFCGEAVLTAVHVINRIPTSHNSDLIRIDPFTSDTDETLPTTTLETPAPPNPPTTTQSSPGIADNTPLVSPLVEAVDNPLWQKVNAEELTALHQTHTWDLVLLPPRKHTIGSRWVYKIKTKSDGSIERYKARLVAKGYSQKHGMDYEETFAPVAKMTTVHTLTVVASVCRWKISQMDVKNAFLNGDLHEEVFMAPPPGVSHQLGEVVYSFMSLYVDDMIITGDDIDGIEALKSELACCFAMKDLGYLLSQSKYIADLFEHARLSDNKIVDTPVETNARYSLSDEPPLLDLTLYRTIVGSLVYLTVTRPDIAHAIHVISQFVTAPTTVHWAAVLHILSKKQVVISRSSTEAEYRAMASTTCEIVWLSWLLADFGILLRHPTPLYCDNQSAIQIACNSVFHERTKHIEIDCHVTRYHLQLGIITLLFVPSSLQIADMFTKAHSASRFRFLSDKLSMILAVAS